MRILRYTVYRNIHVLTYVNIFLPKNTIYKQYKYDTDVLNNSFNFRKINRPWNISKVMLLLLLELNHMILYLMRVYAGICLLHFSQYNSHIT